MDKEKEGIGENARKDIYNVMGGESWAGHGDG